MKLIAERGRQLFEWIGEAPLPRSIQKARLSCGVETMIRGRGPWLSLAWARPKVHVLGRLGRQLPADLGVARGHMEAVRSEEHTSELQSRLHLVCRLLLEKKK